MKIVIPRFPEVKKIRLEMPDIAQIVPPLAITLRDGVVRAVSSGHPTACPAPRLSTERLR